MRSGGQSPQSQRAARPISGEPALTVAPHREVREGFDVIDDRRADQRAVIAHAEDQPIGAIVAGDSEVAVAGDAKSLELGYPQLQSRAAVVVEVRIQLAGVGDPRHAKILRAG